MTVSVVIVNWNAGAQLGDCVESVLTYGGGLVESIVVVDNGSIDGSAAGLEESPKVRVLHAGENLGFGRACNLGAKSCSAEFLLFLNPDARLMVGTLEMVCAFMRSESATGVGICGVRLLDDDGRVHRHCARFPTPWTFLWHSLGLSAVAPSLFPPHFMSEFDHESSREVDQVIGAFFFVRRALFQTLNGFDERFFMYFEELDFALRAKKLGWHSYYLAESTAYHRGGGTSAQVKANRLFFSLRSRLLYGAKNFSIGGVWLTSLTTVVIEPLARIASALVLSPRKGLKETVSAYRMLFAELPRILLSAHARKH